MVVFSRQTSKLTLSEKDQNIHTMSATRRVRYVKSYEGEKEKEKSFSP